MNGTRQLTDRERRLILIGSIVMAFYLVFFLGFKFLGARRSEYLRLKDEASKLRQDALPYKDKVRLVKKLMDDSHMDPARLNPETEVADASAAIQNSARSGGLQLGSIRESGGRGSSMTLATLQLDGAGPIPAVLGFLAGLKTIGYPLIVDSVQFSADNSRPGQVKISMTILILNFDRQKTPTEAAHA